MSNQLDLKVVSNLLIGLYPGDINIAAVSGIKTGITGDNKSRNPDMALRATVATLTKDPGVNLISLFPPEPTNRGMPIGYERSINGSDIERSSAHRFPAPPFCIDLRGFNGTAVRPWLMLMQEVICKKITGISAELVDSEIRVKLTMLGLAERLRESWPPDIELVRTLCGRIPNVGDIDEALERIDGTHLADLHIHREVHGASLPVPEQVTKWEILDTEDLALHRRQVEKALILVDGETCGYAAVFANLAAANGFHVSSSATSALKMTADPVRVKLPDSCRAVLIPTLRIISIEMEDFSFDRPRSDTGASRQSISEKPETLPEPLTGFNSSPMDPEQQFEPPTAVSPPKTYNAFRNKEHKTLPPPSATGDPDDMEDMVIREDAASNADLFSHLVSGPTRPTSRRETLDIAPEQQIRQPLLQP
jgi:hypothetical protein